MAATTPELGPLLQDDTDDEATSEVAPVTESMPSPKKSEIDDKPQVMEVDPKLPEGWSRKVSQRKSGASAGHYDVYILSPDKTRFRSRMEIAAYIKANKVKLDAEDFDFSPFGRHVNMKTVRKKMKVGNKLLEKVKARGRAIGGKATKDEGKKSTPTLASRLKVKMNFSGPGRKRKAAAVEETPGKKTPQPKKKQKLDADAKDKTPAKATPKGKAAAKEEEPPKKRGRGRPPSKKKLEEAEIIEDTTTTTPVNKKVDVMKFPMAKRTPIRKKEEKEESGDNEEQMPAENEKEEEAAMEEAGDMSALEIKQLDASPKKPRRVSKRPGRFAEGLTDEEINAPAPPKVPKVQKPAAVATPKTPAPKKKAPPKPKRKSNANKAAAEPPKRNKEIEEEADLIASLTARLEHAEALENVVKQMDQDEPDHDESIDEPESVSSPETLIRKPNPGDFAADIWSPKPQSSRYSGRKITPKIRSSPEEELVTPRKHAGRGRGKNSKMVKRQNSKSDKLPEVGRKRNKSSGGPPTAPKPRRKTKSESKSTVPAMHEATGHNTTTAHLVAPPANPSKPPHMSEELLNSDIREQTYEEFLSSVESTLPLLHEDDPTGAAAVASTSVPTASQPKKVTSPKAVVRQSKQRTISESEIKLGVPIREEDVIHTPPPTSPLVPADDHTYSASSKTYPALVAPGPSVLGENGEVATPRFATQSTGSNVTHRPATGGISSPKGDMHMSLSSTESTSQGESSEDEESLIQGVSSPPPVTRYVSFGSAQPQQQQQVILGGLNRRRKSSGGQDGSNAGKSIMIKTSAGGLTSLPHMVTTTTSEGQSVLAQVLSRPQEYTASKKQPRGTGKKGRTVMPTSGGASTSGPQQIITQIVSKEGKVVYGGGDSAGAGTPQIIRMSTGAGGQQQLILASGKPGTTSAGGQFRFLQTGEGGKMLVRKVNAPTGSAGQQFTRISNITGVNQRFVLAPTTTTAQLQRRPGQSLLAQRLPSSSSASLVTRILPPAAARTTPGDQSDDGSGAVVVCTPSTANSTTNQSGIKLFFAGSPPRNLGLLSEGNVVSSGVAASSVSSTSASVVSEMICTASAPPADIMASPPAATALLEDDDDLHVDSGHKSGENSPHTDQINRDAANGLENLTDKL